MKNQLHVAHVHKFCGAGLDNFISGLNLYIRSFDIASIITGHVSFI